MLEEQYNKIPFTKDDVTKIESAFKEFSNRKRNLLWFSAVAVSIGIFFFFFVLTRKDIARMNFGVFFSVLFFGVLIFINKSLKIYISKQKLLRDLSSGYKIVLTATLHYREIGKDYSGRWRIPVPNLLFIGNKSFAASDPLFSSAIVGKTYEVHYTPEAELLLDVK